MLAGQPGVPGEFFKFLVEVVKAMVARNMGFMEMLSAQVDYLGASLLHYWSEPNIQALFMFEKHNKWHDAGAQKRKGGWRRFVAVVAEA